MAWIAAVALAANVPLGYLRAAKPKYSVGWFLYIHLSIPLVAFLRIINHLTPWVIPIFLACAVAGQLAGGRLRQARRGGA